MKVYDFYKTHKWTQAYTARDRVGNYINPYSSSAVAFDLIGALLRCYPMDSDMNAAIERLRNELIRRGRKNTSICYYNDTLGRTKDEIIALCKAADV